MEAVLWPQPVRGTISHETALDLLELSDVNPSKIHITVPKAFRTKRQVPSGYVLHFADVDRSDIVPVEGIPTTSAKRAIVDCHKAHVGAFALLQAIEDGLKNGRLRSEEARDLRDLVQPAHATSTPE